MIPHALLFILAALGIAKTVYLIKKRIAQEKPACILGGEKCHLVLESKYNKTFGISNDVFGLAFYVMVAVLTAFLVIEIQPVVWWDVLIKLLIAGGTLFSLYFTYLQWRVIKAWCFWCVSSALIIFAMALIIITSDLTNIQ